MKLKTNVIFIMILLIPIGLSISTYTAKTEDDIPNVVINQVDKNITYLDWGTLTPSQVIETIDTPEELWDYTLNYITYTCDDEIESFPLVHYNGTTDCGEYALAEASMMSNTNYGNCTLQLCSIVPGSDHWMYITNENGTYISFSEDSGYHSNSNVRVIIREMQRQTNYNYDSYGFFCWDEYPDLFYNFTTQNITDVRTLVNFPNCSIDIPNDNNVFGKLENKYLDSVIDDSDSWTTRMYSIITEILFVFITLTSCIFILIAIGIMKKIGV